MDNDQHDTLRKLNTVSIFSVIVGFIIIPFLLFLVGPLLGIYLLSLVHVGVNIAYIYVGEDRK